MTGPPAGADWPESLLVRAEITGSGEALWAATDLPDVIDHAERGSLGIVAIEVYGKVMLARGVFRRELPIDPPWTTDESWERFVDRSVAQARELLRRDEANAAPGDLYFLAAVPEAKAVPLPPA